MRQGRPPGKTAREFSAANNLVAEARQAAARALDAHPIRTATRVLRDVADLEAMLECLGYGTLARRAAKAAEGLENDEL